MTTEIAVINRSAVALAADSAVTVESGTYAKVYNTANKLFTLSKYHPVGIMFYGNADFMHVPWETIIKQFRENLRKKNYVRIAGFADAFIKFLPSYVPCLEEHQRQRVCEIWLSQLDALNRKIHSALLEERASRQQLEDGDVRIVIRNVIRKDLEEIKAQPNASSMRSLDAKRVMRKYAKEYRYAKSEKLYGRPLTPAAERYLKEYCGTLLKKKWFSPVSSGIVIAGFGKNEMFPSLLEYRLDGIFDGRMKIEKTSFQDIARDNRSSIHAFAQGEMVVQFMEGSDADYRLYFENAISALVEKISESIIHRYSAGTENQKNRRAGQVKRASKKMLSQLLDDAEHVRERYFVAPVVGAISVLPKEELANLAEALVNLTSLKRRVSMDMETVGGAIDVAVISKGDGFIWIKRKHYFDTTLNPHFTANYFRSEDVTRRST